MSPNPFHLERPPKVAPPKNPLADPLAHVKQPLSRANRGKAKVEFTPLDVLMIRSRFAATQREFAVHWTRGEKKRHLREGRARGVAPACVTST
jgi:hypothetical protein